MLADGADAAPSTLQGKSTQAEVPSLSTEASPISSATDTAGRPPRFRDGAWLTWTCIGVGVGLVAFVIRLVPVLRGGGLKGFYNYDPAVYYAAAVGMAHGLMPYRDFLLLHAPGVPVALLPFALIGLQTSDSTGMALARLAIMVMGAVTAVLVARVLKPLGAGAAVIGGLAYAVYWPAVYVERAAWLEGFGSFLTVLAMLLVLGVPRFRERHPRWAMALAGASLSLACAVKVWAVVPLLTVLVWVLLQRKWRDAAALTAGAAAAGVAMLLPFITALSPMWQMVVSAQLGRQRGAADTWLMRVEGLSGLNIAWSGHIHGAAVVAAAAIVVISLLALPTKEGRLALLLLATGGVLLMAGPTWFRHYPALIAGPLAVALGAGAGQVIGWLRPRWLKAVALVVASGTLATVGVMLSTERVGTRFAGKQLAQIVAGLPGCLTTDDPNSLIVSNLLDANLKQGCQFVIDLSGYRYVVGDGQTFTKNAEWQRFVREYLGSGSAVILLRGTTKARMDAETKALLNRWPVVDEVNGHAIRVPE